MGRTKLITPRLRNIKRSEKPESKKSYAGFETVVIDIGVGSFQTAANRRFYGASSIPVKSEKAADLWQIRRKLLWTAPVRSDDRGALRFVAAEFEFGVAN